MKTFHYYLSRCNLFGIKSPSMWRHEDNKAHPVIYFRKAKGASQKEFETALKILGFNGGEKMK